MCCMSISWLPVHVRIFYAGRSDAKANGVKCCKGPEGGHRERRHHMRRLLPACGRSRVGRRDARWRAAEARVTASEMAPPASDMLDAKVPNGGRCAVWRLVPPWLRQARSDAPIPAHDGRRTRHWSLPGPARPFGSPPLQAHTTRSTSSANLRSRASAASRSWELSSITMRDDGKS
jgi:hypothetical protein